MKEFLVSKVQLVSSPSLTRWSSNNGRRQVGLPRPLAKQIPTTLASFALSCSENPFRNRISCSKHKHHPNESYSHILNKLFPEYTSRCLTAVYCRTTGADVQSINGHFISRLSKHRKNNKTTTTLQLARHALQRVGHGSRLTECLCCSANRSSVCLP